MTKGLLLIKGTIDLKQFWPENQSDGDTVKVDVQPDGFEFTPDPKHIAPRVVHVFDEAIVRGAEKKPAVHNGKITLRLEHIDAHEMHYAVPLPNTKNYRQHFGETEAIKLHDELASSHQQPVACEVHTLVSKPNEVFDTYARLIGQIILDPSGRKLNINKWMVENGWALPAFYNSATVEEIREFSAAAEHACNAGKGFWPQLTRDLGHPDFTLLFRSHGTPDPQHDTGPVVIPKLFRRLVLWHVSVIDGRFTGTFREFLATLNDPWVRTADFLKNPKIKPTKKQQALSSLVTPAEIFEADAADIVFFEKESTLTDAKGKRITTWDFAAAEPKRKKAVAA